MCPRKLSSTSMSSKWDSLSAPVYILTTFMSWVVGESIEKSKAQGTRNCRFQSFQLFQRFNLNTRKKFNHEVVHDTTLADIVVMPAWIAGIQLRKDAFGDIHVSLGSIAPCWNDKSKRSAWTDRGPFNAVFSKEDAKRTKVSITIRKLGILSCAS